jgi:hypothetical protein
VSLEISASTCSRTEVTPLLGARLLGFVSTLLCARFMAVWEVFLLKNIAKDWLGLLPLLRRVSRDTSCVRVHGISSCDLAYCTKWFMV